MVAVKGRVKVNEVNALVREFPEDLQIVAVNQHLAGQVAVGRLHSGEGFGFARRNPLPVLRGEMLGKFAERAMSAHQIKPSRRSIAKCSS